MAIRIPVYDQPQVQAQGIPGGLQGMTESNAAKVIGIAGQAAQIGFQYKEQADQLRTEDAVNQLRAKQQEYTGWIREMRGNSAFDPEKFGGQQGQSLDQVASEWMSKAGDDISGTLSNGRQKDMFKQAQARLQLEFNGHVQDHLNQQSVIAAKDDFTTTLSAEGQQLALGAVRPDGGLDGTTINQSLGRIRAAARLYAGFAGTDAKTLETETVSGAHAQVIDTLLKRNNAQGAKVYFEVNKDQMDPKLIYLMGDRIQEGILANDVQAHADRIASMGLTLDQQDAEARKTFKGNPEGMKTLQAELEHRFSIKRTAQAAAQQEVFGKLWDMRYPTLPGQKAQSMPQIMRSAEWNALNGTQRNELRAQWESHSKRNEDDPETVATKYATYMQIVDNPKALVSMSDSQIVSFTGSLGVDLTKKLLDMKRKAAGNLEELSRATLSDFPFKEIVEEYGVRTKGSLAKKDLSKVGAIREAAIDAIQDEQRVTGRPLLPDRKEDILRTLLQKIRTRSKGEVSFYEVKDSTDIDATDTERKRVLIRLASAGLDLNDPYNFKVVLEDERRKQKAREE